MNSEAVIYSVEETHVTIEPGKLLADDVVGQFEHMLVTRAPGEKKHVLLDFSNVSAITSRGISAIICCKKAMKNAPYLMGISNLRKELKDLLTAMNINRIIPFFENNDEFLIALNEFEPEPESKEIRRLWCLVKTGTHYSSITITKEKEDGESVPVEKVTDTPDDLPVVIRLQKITSLTEDAIQLIFTILEKAQKSGRLVFFVDTSPDIIDLITLVSDVPFEQAASIEEAERKITGD